MSKFWDTTLMFKTKFKTLNNFIVTQKVNLKNALGDWNQIMFFIVVALNIVILK